MLHDLNFVKMVLITIVYHPNFAQVHLVYIINGILKIINLEMKKGLTKRNETRNDGITAKFSEKAYHLLNLSAFT